MCSLASNLVNMKKFFFTLSLFTFSTISFSQNKIEYANFIQTDTAIKWAAIYNSVVNLTPVNPNFNINNFYFNKIRKRRLQTYTIDSVAFAVSRNKTTYEELLKNISYKKYNSQINTMFNYDNRYDGAPAILYNEYNDCETCLNNKLSLVKVKQLLYYKNNQLYIKNILINPLTYKKNKETTIEETMFAETINVAFDNANIEDTDIPSDAVFIGRSCNKLTLLAGDSSDNKILTTGDWNLFNILLKAIKKNILKAYNPDSSVYPSSNTVLDYQKIDEYKNPADTVDSYDELDAMKSYVVRKDISTESIYNYSLIQDFYFDFNKEKLYSKLAAFIPKMKVISNSGIYLGDINYFGIIFSEENIKIQNKQ